MELLRRSSEGVPKVFRRTSGGFHAFTPLSAARSPDVPSPVSAPLIDAGGLKCLGGSGRQVNSLAGLGGLPGGVQDFGDDEVELERGQAGGLDFPANDGGKVSNLVGKGAWHGRREQLEFAFLGPSLANAEQILLRQIGRASCSRRASRA